MKHEINHNVTFCLFEKILVILTEELCSLSTNNKIVGIFH